MYSLLPNELKLDVDWETVREGRLRELHYYRLDRNKPSPTINTRNAQYFHPVEIRYFTARELATFQSFPVDYKFMGKYTSQLRQIGNAVPPLMSKALGEEILKSYELKIKEVESDQDDIISESVKYAFNYDNCEGIKARFRKQVSQ